MKYPISTTEVKLYDLDHRELRTLAKQAVDVAEPKYVRIAFKAGILIAAISIVGLPIACILKTYRDSKRDADVDAAYDQFSRIARMQELHHIEEAVTFEWQGNKSPNIKMTGDTALLWQAAKKHPEVAEKYPSFTSFNLSRLRYNTLTNPQIALLSRNLFDDEVLADPQAPQPPSYGSAVDEPPPPNYNELETRF